MIPKPLQQANWALAFVLELVALGALFWWGFHAGAGLALHLLLGLGAPVLTAMVWGTFLAPRATRPLPVPVAITAKLAVFLVAALAAYTAGAHTFALAFAAVAVLNTALLAVDREAMELQGRSARG